MEFYRWTTGSGSPTLSIQRAIPGIAQIYTISRSSPSPPQFYDGSPDKDGHGASHLVYLRVVI